MAHVRCTRLNSKSLYESFERLAVSMLLVSYNSVQREDILVQVFVDIAWWRQSKHKIVPPTGLRRMLLDIQVDLAANNKVRVIPNRPGKGIC